MNRANCPNAKRSGNHPVFPAGSRAFFWSVGTCLMLVLAAGLGCWTEVAFDPSTQPNAQGADAQGANGQMAGGQGSDGEVSDTDSTAPTEDAPLSDPLEDDRYALQSGEAATDGGLAKVEGMAAQAILAPNADEKPPADYDPLLDEQSGAQSPQPKTTQQPAEQQQAASESQLSESPNRMPWETPQAESDTAEDELFSGLIEGGTDDDPAPAEQDAAETPPAVEPQPTQPGFLESIPDRYGESADPPPADQTPFATSEESTADSKVAAADEPQAADPLDFLSGPVESSVEQPSDPPVAPPAEQPAEAPTEAAESLLPDFLKNLEKDSDPVPAPEPDPPPEEKPAAAPMPLPEPPAAPPRAPSGEARAVKIKLADTRLMAWTLGGKVVLARLPALTDSALAESCRADAEALAEALSLPTAAGESEAVSPASSADGLSEADLVGLLNAGRSLGEDLAAGHGQEHAALLELAVKSTAAPIISGQRPDLSPVLARAVRLAAQRTRLPVRTWVPLVQALEQRLPAAEVRPIAESMYAEVEASLREN